jgi:hypothetical protein
VETTPLAIAVDRGHDEIAELLRKHEVMEGDAENDTTDTPQDPNQKDS